jgi:signal transduction histidine kinase/CheY-like chemotaxis protein
LNEQLTLREDEKVVNELNRINIRLEKIPLVDTIKSSSVEGEKKGFFKRLFGRKDQPKGDTIIARSLDKQLINEVKKEVNKARVKQLVRLEETNKREAAIIEKDKEIMSRLVSLFANMEAEQDLKLKAIAVKNINHSARTNSLIKIFGGLMTVILVSLGCFAIYYFYQGRIHRKNLIRMALEAKTLAKTRENFLSNMSHEMRTPLNSIVGFTEQVLQTNLHPQQKEQIELVNASSMHLLDLVNNLLDKARIDAGKVTVEKVDFNLYSLINDSVKMLEVKAKEKNIALIREIEMDENSIVNGDPVLLRQIIINILGNAIKFTKQGEVVINAGLKIMSDNSYRLTLSVKDTGIGIAKEKIKNIFNHFEQLETGINRVYGGTGLGLSITKDLVDILNGKISLTSEKGKGTEVSVSILYGNSLNISKTAQLIKRDKDINASVLANKNILVVDDEMYNRKLLSVILRKYDINVTEAQSGLDALEQMDKAVPDLALVDINMAEMDGIKMMLNLRAKTAGKYKVLPVIAVTADLSEEKKENYLQSGFNECLMKPFNEKELISLIVKTLIAHEMNKTKYKNGERA